MIHFHGTPLTPRSELFQLAGKHFCVSKADPRDAEVCLQIGQSVLWDSGAFTAYTQGRGVDWHGYFVWLENKLTHPHFAVVPDEIGGDQQAQEFLVKQWPFSRHLGAPVWHLNLSIDYLLALADIWPRICFGSSGQYWQVGSPAWERRVDEAFNALTKRHRILPWIHMLRGMSTAGKRWPFASTDSCNVARNFKDRGESPEYIARCLDAVQCPAFWRNAPIQGELWARDEQVEEFV